MSGPSTSSARGDGLHLAVNVRGLPPRYARLDRTVYVGRDRMNDVVIDHPAVRPTHAVIEPSMGDVRLSCVEGAFIILNGGIEVPRLKLIEGVSFTIGNAALACVAMKQAPAPAGPEMVCEHCGHPLDSLPAAARFCPWCGVNLAYDPEVWDELPFARAARVESRAPVREPGPSGEVSHSMVIKGYATAMHSLGTRYERGVGVHRNEDEAIRCYSKSARLGNESALGRLLRWVGGRSNA